MMSNKRIRRIQGVVLGAMLGSALLTIAPVADSENTELPELGSSATKFLNPAQEKLIGQQFLLQLRASSNFVEDYELQDYLQTMGDHIGAGADLHGSRLTFNLLQDNNLNAFAVPGGYITFNTGLIMETERESELASVVGHEIAHLSQRHLPRLLAKADEQKIPAIAAIIGSILLGGQAGLAGLTATNAALASNQLAYTRDFEREADAIGIQLMAEARYDPLAMADFFGKLERFTRHESDIPEFLLTHPLSYARIAESAARAKEFPRVDHASSFEYHLAKAKIRALYADRRGESDVFFEHQADSDNPLESDAGVYGYAAVLIMDRKYDKANARLAPVVARHPDHPWVQVAQAQIELGQGDSQQAIDRLDTLVKNNPGRTWMSYYLADAYLRSEQPAKAKKAVRYQLRRHPEDFRLYRYLSMANVDLGKFGEAHQAEAEYHAALGNYRRAIGSLKLAQREAGDDGYLTQSIASRMVEFERLFSIQKQIQEG